MEWRSLESKIYQVLTFVEEPCIPDFHAALKPIMTSRLRKTPRDIHYAEFIASFFWNVP